MRKVNQNRNQKISFILGIVLVTSFLRIAPSFASTLGSSSTYNITCPTCLNELFPLSANANRETQQSMHEFESVTQRLMEQAKRPVASIHPSAMFPKEPFVPLEGLVTPEPFVRNSANHSFQSSPFQAAQGPDFMGPTWYMNQQMQEPMGFSTLDPSFRANMAYSHTPTGGVPFYSYSIPYWQNPYGVGSMGASMHMPWQGLASPFHYSGIHNPGFMTADATRHEWDTIL